MRYRYVKRNPSKKPNLFPQRKIPWFVSGLLLIGGVVILVSAIFPIIFYQVFLSPQFIPLLNPSLPSSVLGEETAESTPDYTLASSWFPEAPKLPTRPSRVTHYTLSIPRLKIEEAIVEIGGEDLKKSLIHYRGTAFPGQFGNAVIFGHSSLPQFFNPKNYVTIFATLPTLKIGDDVLVNFDGVLYRYVVEKMFEVKPEDYSILEQRYDDFYLTLVTCVPPGTYARRLIVRTKLKRT